MPTNRFNLNHYPLDAGTRLLEASAGTGKTFSLAHLVLRLLTEKEIQVDKLLVISFTKATASEIKSKIITRLGLALKALEDLSNKSTFNKFDDVLIDWLENKVNDKSIRLNFKISLIKALEKIDSADITTIHAFCSKSLRREAIQTGSQINPQPLTEEENINLIYEIIHQYWKEQLLDLHPDNLKGITNTGFSIESLVRCIQTIESDPGRELSLNSKEININDPISIQFNKCLKESWQNFVQEWQRGGFALDTELKRKASEWKKMGIANTKPFSSNPKNN